MTKTYSDIDAVTRLLEEKERDLELAARIGQSLLKKNKALSERNGLLEEQVEHIREEVSQLRHDLSMKDELLQFYTSAAEDSEGESTTSTVRLPEISTSPPTFFPLDLLQKKLKDLEEENKSLRSEASHLETETISYEEKEQQLVNDCVKELRDANRQMASLAEELAKKTEDGNRQQEEITHLLSQIVDLQRKAKMFAVENEELTQHLGAAKDAQRQLTTELQELQDKYAECIEMLHEAQEELKNFRNKTLPLSTPRRFHSLGLFPLDSLAAEIEGTMRKELQMDDPDVEEQRRLVPKRVFQTVKNMNLMRQQRASSAPTPMNIPGSNRTSSFNSGQTSHEGTPRCNSVLSSDTGGGIILDNRTSSILEASYTGSEDSNKRPPGTPGTPGSKDLEAALRRLSLRRDNYISEKRFFEDERERKLAYLAKEDEKGGEEGSRGPGTPTESLFSLCTHPSLGSVWSGYSFTARSYLPEKLQIVKPLEGEYLTQKNDATPLDKERKGPNFSDKPNRNILPTDLQNTTFQGYHQKCYLIHNCSESSISVKASQLPRPLERPSSLFDVSRSLKSQPQLRTPLALVIGLLQVLEPPEGALSPQHSFYFRHTQPRCCFEL
uniref:Trafficking protein, kinesin binding 1a n=1 Tax=Neogobius melanostomus TaxID=47308 RepID=A0A8C6SAV4_9GOBI